MPSVVFISHAIEDASMARQFCEALEANGVACWIAPRDIRPGRPYDEEIVDAISSAGLLVVLLSTSANASDGVKREVELASARGTPLVPIRIEDVLPSRKLEFHLSALQWIDGWAIPVDAVALRAAGAVRDLLGTDLDKGPMPFIPPPSPPNLDASIDRLSVVGRSPQWQSMLALVRRVAPLDVSVLVSGERGTGKEVVCRMLHVLSPRTERPFVTVNACVLPPGQVAIEFFGAEAGAIAGLPRGRPGLFEIADGGTIFLDEIDELSPEGQAALRVFLQRREIVRVGGHRSTRTDVRVVAASLGSLPSAVAAGRFAQDVYDLLEGVRIEVPPLRFRKGDIPLLVDRFVKEAVVRFGRTRPHVSPQAMEHLERYAWPGNVRELKNEIERAVVLCEGSIELEDLCLDVPP